MSGQQWIKDYVKTKIKNKQMHEFKITIKLADKNYCNGCPLLIEIGIMPEEANCVKYLNHITSERIYPHKYIRPDICKANDKEASNG